MNTKVDVVAVGARTPVGLSAESSAAAVRAQISRVREHPILVDASGEPLVFASDGLLDPQLGARDRMVVLAESALAEVVTKLSAAMPRVRQLALYLALPESRPGFSERDANGMLDSLRARWRSPPSMRVTLAGRGHAGAIRAVESAVQEMRGNEDTLFVVAGVDSYHEAETLHWLGSTRRLVRNGARDGFTPGEAAGCLVLANAGLCSRLCLHGLAHIRGVGTAQEQPAAHSDGNPLGVALSESIQRAVSALELPRDAIDTVYSDINGERFRSEEWGFALLRAPSVWKSPGYHAPAGCWGDVGAASGVLGSVLAVQSFVRRYARGPRAVVVASSGDGLRGALLLESPV
ncbi:hypothetical protein DRW03_02640 [Corallococcus sp. H22C18031201]|nr:hypothetical protein DRW03_02640 [Corallococcus sp. H22C18031201]